IGRNSVVAMPKARTASAYSHGGVRGEALAMLVACGLRGSAQARRLHFQQEGRRRRISFNQSLKMTDRRQDMSLFLRVLWQGRALVEDLEALTSGLRDGADGVGGTLRVTISAAFGREYISPLLPGFMARHPRLRVYAHLSDEMVDLVGAGFDLAIRIGTLDDSSLVARRLASNRRVLCASPDYLRRHGRPRTPEDLARHECVLLAGRSGRQDVWRLTDGDGREHAVRVQGRLETTLGELVRDAVLAGQGIAQHSLWHVHET